MTKVLMVEDSQVLLESIAFELEMHGYAVLQATNGKNALDVLTTAVLPPDIIVSDIAMPDMDGFEFLKMVRSEMTWAAIPFLFMTAFSSADSIRTSRRLGADDYIIKPFQSEDLIIAIENKLQRVSTFRSEASRNLDEARQKLINMMSHELRTPLTSIYGGMELLADYLGQAPDQFVQQMLEMIQNGSNRLHRLTNKALALLQIDSGHMKRVFMESSSIHDMHHIITEAQNRVLGDPDLAANLVKIRILREDSPAFVWGVREYLVMMVEELLRNAVSFSPKNGEVYLEVKQEKEQILVLVQDYGRGIRNDDLPIIWERFSQLNREKYEQQGIGLGLTIVRESALIHHGNCMVESQLGQGTRAFLSLPTVKIS